MLFLLPSLLGFGLFYLIPFAGGIVFSLLDRPVRGRFIGLANYAALLANPVFLRAASNTLIFSGICLPLIVALALLLALLLNGSRTGLTALRTSFIIPLAVPVASIVLVWQIVFDYQGPINALLARFGAAPVDWMAGPTARWVILSIYLWKNTGYDMILILAGLQGIPRAYYEAAVIDGAGRWRLLTRITLVYLAPTLFFVLVVSIINSFRVFRETYLMAGAYPQKGIYILQHYMNNTFASLDYQKLTSAAVLMSLAVYCMVLLIFLGERRLRDAIS